jgi:hypothetical protein
MASFIQVIGWLGRSFLSKKNPAIPLPFQKQYQLLITKHFIIYSKYVRRDLNQPGQSPATGKVALGLHRTFIALFCSVKQL